MCLSWSKSIPYKQQIDSLAVAAVHSSTPLPWQRITRVADRFHLPPFAQTARSRNRLNNEHVLRSLRGCEACFSIIMLLSLICSRHKNLPLLYSYCRQIPLVATLYAFSNPLGYTKNNPSYTLIKIFRSKWCSILSLPGIFFSLLELTLETWKFTSNKLK